MIILIVSSVVGVVYWSVYLNKPAVPPPFSERFGPFSLAWRKKVLLQDKDDNLLCFDEFRNSVVLVEHSDSGVGHAVSDSTLIIAALGGEEVQIEIKIKNNRLYRISKNFTFKSEEIPKGVASRLANYVIGSCLNCVWEDIVASTLLPSPTTAPGNEQKHEGLSSESNSPESK